MRRAIYEARFRLVETQHGTVIISKDAENKYIFIPAFYVGELPSVPQVKRMEVRPMSEDRRIEISEVLKQGYYIV